MLQKSVWIKNISENLHHSNDNLFSIMRAFDSNKKYEKFYDVSK